MATATKKKHARGEARMQLLDAALIVIRERGFTASTVEALCDRAKVTKGAFFHHFDSKEALGVAVAAHWAETTSAFFDAAPYNALAAPLDRLLGYIDFRKSIIAGDPAEFTCLVGTMAQEVYGTYPSIRQACAASIFSHAEKLVPDIEAAMAERDMRADWTAASLAAHTQAVLQGAFILAKATGDPNQARTTIDHLKRYIELLFDGEATHNQFPKGDNQK